MWEGSHLGFPCGSHDPGGNLFSWLKWGVWIPLGFGVAKEVKGAPPVDLHPAVSFALAKESIDQCLETCRNVPPAPLSLADHHPFKIQSVGY